MSVTSTAAGSSGVYRVREKGEVRSAEAGAGRGLLRRWAWRSPVHSPRAGGEGLAEAVLLARGLAGEAASRFLEPKLTHLHDPSLIPDLDRAAERLLNALKAGEPVVIYGDYDVDGVTATAILFHTFRAIAPEARVSTYVPHRVDEGYGVHTAALETLAAQGAKVVVTVDCGVSAIAPAKRARELGLDLIVTDHHNPPARLEDLPEAFAVVHPRRPDSRYPFGELSGAGVAFKLAWRLATMHSGAIKVNKGLQTLLLDLLPFAALGAIADVVPLVDENRVIAWAGLGRMRSSPVAGLGALIRASSLDAPKVSSWDVGFKLAPRLNASGRMAHAAAAVELFTTATPERAREIAEDLEKHNHERRAVEAKIFEQAAEMAARAGMDRDDRRAVVLAHAEWHPGVVGIVCSRLVERFGRPAILLALSEGSAHGSCRSIPGYPIVTGLASAAPLLTKFGGHDMAAGLALDAANVPAFVEAFTAHANAAISVEQLTPTLTIDAAADLGELTVGAVKSLEQLEPHGAGNPGVSVLVRGAQIAAPPAPLGATGKHLAMTLRAPGQVSVTRVVGWNWGPRRAELVSGQRVDAVVCPAISTFGGGAKVEPELKDLRLL